MDCCESIITFSGVEEAKWSRAFDIAGAYRCQVMDADAAATPPPVGAQRKDSAATTGIHSVIVSFPSGPYEG